MDDAAIGRSLFLLRTRQRLRQADVGEIAGVSQDEVSLVERGHLAQVPLGTLRRIFEAAGASLISDVRWRGGDLERLRDARHAPLVTAFARTAAAFGWMTMPEVTYSEFGERGSIDLLCLNQASLAIAVTEMKTDLNLWKPRSGSSMRRFDLHLCWWFGSSAGGLAPWPGFS